MTIRLNVGSGPDKKSGWLNLDIVDGETIDIVADIDDLHEPLPMKDNTVSFMRMEHTLEHLRSPLPAFDELYRLAAPDCRLWVTCPYAYSEDAWADPTNVRPIIHRFFTYLAQPKYHSFDYGYSGDWQPIGCYFILWDAMLAEDLADKFKAESNEAIAAHFKKSPELVKEIGCDLIAIKPARVRDRSLMAGTRTLIKPPTFNFEAALGGLAPPQPANLKKKICLPRVRILGAAFTDEIPEAQEEDAIDERVNIVDTYSNAYVLGDKPLIIDAKGTLQKGGFSFANAWYLHDRVTLNQDKATVELGPVTEIGGEALLLGYSGHYGHFYTDLLDRIANIARVNYDSYILSHQVTAEYITLISGFLGISEHELEEKIVVPEHGGSVLVEKLDCPRIMGRKRKLSEHLPRRLREFKDRLGRREISHNIRNIHLHELDRIFISRKNAKKRRLYLSETDKNTLLNRKFTEIAPEEFSLEQQIEIFRRSRIIILPAGSECYNLLYCTAGAQVLVFMAEPYVEQNMDFLQTVRHICKSAGVELTLALCDVDGEAFGTSSLFDLDLQPKTDVVIEFLRRTGAM